MCVCGYTDYLLFYVEIPKAGSIFLLSIGVCKESFTLYGNQLQFRAAERAVRKFKVKPTIDL